MFNFCAFNDDGSCGYADKTYDKLLQKMAADGVDVTDYTFYSVGKNLKLVLVEA